METREMGLGNGSGFNTQQYAGSLSLVPVPSKRNWQRITRNRAGRFALSAAGAGQTAAAPTTGRRPVPERAGEPSVFQHVIYIIKENRTYDQVLGDVTEGNGDADLCVFGERVTPNQHKLVRDFVLLDNTYCCSILSADGHQWADSGIATDYVEREFAGWPRSYPAAAATNAAGRAGLFAGGFHLERRARARQNGCAISANSPPTINNGRIRRAKANRIFSIVTTIFWAARTPSSIPCEPDIESLRPYIVTNTIGWDLDVPDVWRAAQFIKDLKQFEAADNLPNLVILWLPNDHTSGTKFGSPTPAAQVADNDLAVGQVVEAVSHSKFWKNTCIFAVEDDPQNGWDHVSGYRTTAYVASAYTKRGAVVSTQYNQTSLLRTMELMLGLPPMNQMDATATPMFDCFTNTPDFTPFDAVANQMPLDQMNPAPKKISDSRLRRDAYVSGASAARRRKTNARKTCSIASCGARRKVRRRRIRSGR